MRLQGVQALVTGGSRGIGRAIVEAFANEGARVIAVARTEPDLRKLEQEFAGRVIGLPLDLLDREGVRGIPDRVQQTLGGLDVLVNNAGIWMERAFLEYTREEWDQTLATNLTAAFDVTQALLPLLLQSQSARIVNIAAIDGEVGFAKLAAQCASKFGLIGLTKALAKELWDKPVTVNAICPAEVDTSVAYSETPNRKAGPAKGLPWDVACAAVYLASEEGVRVTGACLDIHGIGFLAA